METVRRIAHFGPLMFAVGFLTPLFAQVMVALEIVPPFDLSPIVAGLILAIVFAVPAQIRGRWI